ncbi:MAG TPA: NAD(P)H-hydrate epimerase, partial [Jatrophihabitans sp.]|nr:NAD(P)H-hydrate epimerase [Jatrophihabitans sp.]
MRGVYPVAQIRAAEDALMAQLPKGALMARAATGLAVECGRLLGRVYGARVVLLVGAGNNGGDALYAGAALAR